jgi:hypothetical protein
VELMAREPRYAEVLAHIAEDEARRAAEADVAEGLGLDGGDD